jgi:hypothetical protein
MKKVISLFSIFSVSLLVFVASCSDEDEPLPPIGGYNTSDEVAAANNVAKFSFEGTNNELKGNISPTTAVGATFTTGAKGQGLTLTDGYILYPAITALSATNSLANSSISAWVKIKNNGTSPTILAALTQTTAAQLDWNTGPLLLMAENGKPAATDDTLVLKSLMSTWAGTPAARFGGDNINDYGVRETDFKTVKTGGSWVHVVARWDAATSKLEIFANGILVSNVKFAYRERGNPDVAMGPITTTTATQLIIGGFPNSNTGFPSSVAQSWQKNMTGSLDELRVYTKALTNDEILALYELEKAGR